jgi:tRNA dimethylallyltransferase
LSVFVPFTIDLLKKCWFLAGPTACGKTAVSMRLAERLQAEIIALDSMTLYRGMDIGTAKPSVEEQSRVRHHLIDILDPHEEFSLAEYLSEAEAACRGIISRGHIPLFVGGAGLYLRGLLRGVFEGPPADWEIRQRLESLAQSKGPNLLFDQLQRVDPASAKRLHPNDQRRIIRALEVFEILGQTLSSLQQQGLRPYEERPPHVYWLSPPREWLYRRIDDRVETMLALGLVNEVRNLITRPQPLSHTASQGLGYKEIIGWLQSNPPDEIAMATTATDDEFRSSVKQLKDLIQTRTRQFAKRQMTWFRNLSECHPIVITGNEKPDEIADSILLNVN